MSIRWREQDNNNLKKAVRNYNAKITRQIKKGISPEALPNKISYKEMKKEIKERKEYNNLIKEINDFNKSKNVYKTLDNGTIVNEWYYANTQKKVHKINKQRKKDLEKIANSAVIVQGKKIDNVQRVVQKQTLQPLNNDLSKKDNFKKFAEYVEKEIKKIDNDTKFNNYVQNLSKAWYKNLTFQQAKTLEEKAYIIGGKKLKELYLTGYQEIDIDFPYGAYEQEEKFNNINKLFDSLI